MMLAIKRSHLLIAVAWSVHAISWFLPATKSFLDGFVPPLRGWESFLVASCAFRPCDESTFDTPYKAVLSGISVIVTLLFIFASPLAVRYKSHSLQRALAWTMTVAFVLNIHWYFLYPSGWPGLAVGYFLWWLSFGLLAAGLFDLSQRNQSPESTIQPKLSHS
jgi:hypothetical protein